MEEIDFGKAAICSDMEDDAGKSNQLKILLQAVNSCQEIPLIDISNA